ncbi:hypothetical protein [Peribacillus frigoritolerans]|uniref:hypothetical protein n=1 Tax=Peribacillus frigoritolerans TaxID=450367 RepID=UPI0024C1C941|nr:hypothetical protein [Peribacillus frigoritolerans]WHX61534.1 hypothetical protein QNH33_23590 [Peribacillus frigoritolerans]
MADRPRKASAWSGNQLSKFTNRKKSVGKVLSNIKNKVIGTEGARLLRESESRGDPAGAKAPRADRPRKASA